MKIKNKFLKQMINQFEKNYHIKFDDIPKTIIDLNKVKDSYVEALNVFINIIDYQEFLIKVVNKDNFKYLTGCQYEVEDGQRTIGK